MLLSPDPAHDRFTLVVERDQGSVTAAALRSSIELYFDTPFDELPNLFLPAFDDLWTWLGRDRFGYWRNEAMSSFTPVRRFTHSSVHHVLRRGLPRDVGAFVAKGVAPGYLDDSVTDRVPDVSIAAKWFSGRGAYAGAFAGELRLIDSSDQLVDEATVWLDRVLRICETLPVKSGVVGFAAERTGLSGEELSTLYAAAMRHPGVELANDWNMAMAQPNAIKGVNWLTVLSHAAISQLGSLDKLRADLDRAIVIHETRHAIVLQAGPRPRLGDVNQGDLLPEYREIYRTLRSLHEPMIEAAAPLPLGRDDDDERTEAWLRRFDN